MFVNICKYVAFLFFLSFYLRDFFGNVDKDNYDYSDYLHSV